MSSIELPPQSRLPLDWRSAGQSFFSLNFFLRQKFGRRVWKISLDGGLDCPNRDGTLDTAGCVFCDPASFSPSRRRGIKSIADQRDDGMRRLRTRYRAEGFVAYFQPGTNTYAPAERLRVLYQQAISHPDVVGLAVGTRPDCVSDEVLDLLGAFARRTWVSVEYGLQSVHDRTLKRLNRHHCYADFLDAHQRSRRRGLTVAAHVILGLPGESREDMRATAGELARLGIDSVKLHNLYAVRNTPLAAMVASGEVEFCGLDEYAGCVVDFLELLPPDCVIDRLSGDAPPQYLVGPTWCLDKPAVRAAVEAEFRRRDTWQGRKHGGKL